MADDTDIARTANLLSLRHGDAAISKARLIVAELQSAGDYEGGDIWLRVILAIEALRLPPSGALNYLSAGPVGLKQRNSSKQVDYIPKGGTLWRKSQTQNP